MLKTSVWATIQKYKRQWTISRLPGFVGPTLLQIVRELRNLHLSFGNARLRINDYVIGKLPLTVNQKKVKEITVNFFESYCTCVRYRHVYVLHVCVYYMHMCGLHTFPLHNVHCSARLPIFSFLLWKVSSA